MPRKKPTPAVRHLRYLLTHNGAGSEDSHYIDVAKNLSEINRRLYRQGKEYHIAGITVHTTSSTFVKACVIPNTWVSRNAWVRGFKKWKEMQSIAFNGVRKPSKYNDFKVYLNTDHFQAVQTSTDVPQPVDSGNNSLLGGSWDYSRFWSPDGTSGADEFWVHMMGTHVGSAGSRTNVGLIKSYAESRPTVQTDVPLMDSEGDDDPLINLFDSGTQVDEIAADLDNFGDYPPYSLGANAADVGEDYVGSEDNLPKPIVVGETATSYQSGGGISIGHIGPFSAICGLIEIETFSTADTDTIELLVELMPGSYKGVAASEI